MLIDDNQQPRGTSSDLWVVNYETTDLCGLFPNGGPLMKIKKGDLVRVLSGKDKGTEGHVMSVDSENNRITVEGVHTGRKHQPHANK